MRQVNCPNPQCVMGHVGFKKILGYAGKERLELQDCPICFGFGKVNEDQYELHQSKTQEKDTVVA